MNSFDKANDGLANELAICALALALGHVIIVALF